MSERSEQIGIWDEPATGEKPTITGATDAEIEAAATRYHQLCETDPDTYRAWEEIGRHEQAVLKDWAEDILSAAVPVGARIVSAEWIESLRRVIMGWVTSDMPIDDLIIVRDVLPPWQPETGGGPTNE